MKTNSKLALLFLFLVLPLNLRSQDHGSETLPARSNNETAPGLTEVFQRAKTVLPSGKYDLTKFRATQQDFANFISNVPLANLSKPRKDLPDCTDVEIKMLTFYAAGAAYQYNSTLRKNKLKVGGIPIDKIEANEILMLSSAVNCIPQFKGTLYRGLGDYPEDLKKEIFVGNHIIFPAFSSTSKDEKVANHFAHAQKKPDSVKFIIRNAIGGDMDFTKLSAHVGEKEVILNPGTVFKVLSEKIEVDLSIDATRVHVIELEQVETKSP